MVVDEVQSDATLNSGTVGLLSPEQKALLREKAHQRIKEIKSRIRSNKTQD